MGAPKMEIPMTDTEAAVIEIAMEWAMFRNGYECGMPTQANMKAALEKLYNACGDLSADCEGERWVKRS